jgi:hypothetical protein
VAAVGVQGMGGVGKTTACLVRASDQEVASAYPDAGLRMSLGLDVTTEAVVDQLAGIVEKTGGALSATLMRDTFKKNGTGNSTRSRTRRASGSTAATCCSCWTTCFLQAVTPALGTGCSSFSTASGVTLSFLFHARRRGNC